RPGSNTGRSSGAARSAFNKSSCAGLSVRVSTATPQPYAAGVTVNADLHRLCANRPVRAFHAHSIPNIVTVTPFGDDGDVESPSLRFAAAVRALGLEARRAGLRMPAFRSPPRLDGVARSVRRRADGNATIAVVVRDRPWAAVLADMVEGIVVANHLHGPD